MNCLLVVVETFVFLFLVQLLDIRPQHEYRRAHVRGSLHIPYFVEDLGTDPLTWLKRAAHAGIVADQILDKS